MEDKYEKAYFSHVDEAEIHVFANGKSSFTAHDDDIFIVDIEDIVLYKKRIIIILKIAVILIFLNKKKRLIFITISFLFVFFYHI